MKKLRNVMLALALLLVVVTPVMADGTTDVDTNAVVDACGLGPDIKAKWESSEQWSKDPNAVCGPDCQEGKSCFEVIPNWSDVPGEPGKTEICVTAVITDPNGIGDIQYVYFRVYEPCSEDVKVRVDMSKVTHPTLIEKYKHDGFDTGQLTQEQVDDINEEIDCGQAAMYRGCWEYDNHQVAGCYRIVVHAVDKFGNSTMMENKVCIRSIVVLALDFTAVDFGAIVPGGHKWILGDAKFVQGDGLPTVWNRGNDPASLCVHFTEMVGQELGEKITRFDCKLLDQAKNFCASVWDRMDGPIEPCTPLMIKFSIRPPTILTADNYVGAINFQMVHEGGVCMK